MIFPHQELTDRIINCIIQTHRKLGPGFLESIYKKALIIQLRKEGLSVECEKEISITFDGQEIGKHRLDLVVDATVILELKTVEAFSPAHYSQIRSYLRASNLPVGFLVNFARERSDFRRVDNPRRFAVQ